MLEEGEEPEVGEWEMELLVEELDREEEEVVVVGRRTRWNVNVNLYLSLLAREVKSLEEIYLFISLNLTLSSTALRFNIRNKSK